MVITGPILAQPIVKPPVSENEITKAFNTLKQVGSGNNIHSNKQAYSGHTFGNDYTPHKSYGIPIDKAWKYADVFATVPQQSNYYSTNIETYPVDNENVIPPSNFVPQKDASNFTGGVFDKSPFTFDSSIPSKLDFDLSALLAAPSFMKQEASPEHVIPDHPLEFNYGNIPSTEQNVFDNSMGIWGEAIPKDNPVEVFENTEQQIDPFVSEFQLEPRLYPVASTESLVMETRAQGSPLSSAALDSPMNQGSPWEDNNFQQLLKETPLDFSDMDFFLPPPSKRIHDSPEPVVMSSYPASPEPLAEGSSPTDEDDYVKPKPRTHSPSPAEKPKSKSTVLFGKHEDEIIHKLLVPGLSTPSKPITRDKLVSMPVEEFNHLLEVAKLNDIEIAFMKEWRRRGKNKTAAQVARKRKREEVGDLESEVEAMRQQKAELQTRYRQLRSEIKSLKERSLAAENRVYKQHSQNSGQSVSRDTHLIHVARGNKLLLVPKINPQIISVN